MPTSHLFQRAGFHASMASLTAGSTDALARLCLDLEHARKVGWAAFFGALDMHGAAFGHGKAANQTIIRATRTARSSSPTGTTRRAGN